MKIIGLYPNLRRDQNLEKTKKVVDILTSLGARVLVPAPISLSGTQTVTEEELFSQSQVLITLGGDGTILSVSARAARHDLPILGINLGKVGFMASLEEREMEKIRRLFSGDYTVSSRMLLSCQINGKEEMLALNELVFAPEKGFHIVELSLFCGRKKLCDFRADGVIFNTPTGSTGYSFSAGGAVMDAQFDAIGVKAVSSYLLINSHHMIFSPDTTFQVRRCRSEDSPVTVIADGREERKVAEGDVIRIARSEKRVKLISFDRRSSLEVFFRKF